MLKQIKALHQAVYAPIDDLITYRALPTRTLQQLDPFLFLNHHGPQTYSPNNHGLPFGPHPHRGFETLTFILKGDIVHWDSSGSRSVIKAGGIQWMTAGSGLIHSEVSSEEFKKKGGEEEVLQLWMNLPARYKMIEPRYVGKSREELTHFSLDHDKVEVHLISGQWGDQQGTVESLTGLMMSYLDMQPGGSFHLAVPTAKAVFFYVVKGRVEVNGQQARMHQLVEFGHEGEEISVKAQEESVLLLGHGTPFGEPIVAQGPFVMNSEAEIMQAYQDFRAGKMGRWDQ